MKSYLLWLPVTAVALLPITSMADTSYISFEHNYRLENRFHSDKLSLTYKFDGGLRFQIAANLINKKRDSFDDPTNYSEYFDTSYQYAINEQLSVIPSIRMKFYTGAGDDYDFSGEIGDSGDTGARYIPGVAVRYAINDELAFFTGYQYEWRKFTHKKEETSEPNQHRNVYKIGASYQLSEAMMLTYTAQYQDSDYTLYDNKRSNYEQGALLSYRVNRDWQPYLGVDDVAVATDSDHREAKLTAGFNFYF
ncbi:hypothetical protein F9817_07445 [Vibrio sp. CAIM 722]|uniref:Porin n=1 Tax=Vibrio eleionomae TaxID=2653505 RepID=A0A7X4LK44_9VIBR|nr:oligogalacturonate-specific porin KdgM family protein [Vibrio eleionomae]MZI93031.1 hypothetical protein [Vibrio eleionomae]